MWRSDVMALGVIVGGAGFGLMATSQLLSARPAGQLDSIRHESRVIRISAPSVETVVTMVCEDDAFAEVNLDGLNIAMDELRLRMSEMQERTWEVELREELETLSTEIEEEVRSELEQAGVELELASMELDEVRQAASEARAAALQNLRVAQIGQAFEIQSTDGLVELMTLHSDSDDNRKCKRRRRHPASVRVRVQKIERP